MRNLKKVLCLALVLSMVLAVVSGAAYYRTYKDYADITRINEEYVIAAQVLNDLGIVVGIPGDGGNEYAPNETLSRAQLARVLYVLDTTFVEGSLFNPGDAFDNVPCTFEDIKENWAEGEIRYGFKRGYLSGRNAKTYDPDAPVSVREMATALLAVIGYEKEELAKDWPTNVIMYGYQAQGNLFTTGLSTNPSDTTITGIHIAGYQTGAEAELEGELKLSDDITREQAFYMLFKATALRPTVTKQNFFQQKGDYYANGLTFLDANYGFDYTAAVGPVAGVVTAGKTEALDNKGTGTDGVLKIDGVTYYDLGWGKTGQYANGNSGTGFFIADKNWDECVGYQITGKTFTLNGKRYVYGYEFNTDTMTVTGLKGSKVTVKAGSAVAVNADGVSIDIAGKNYKLDPAGVSIKVNGQAAVNFAAGAPAAIVAELGNAGTGTAHELTLVLSNGKLYAAYETEYTFAQITAISADKKKITLDTVACDFDIKDADGKALAADGKQLKVGDYVYGTVVGTKITGKKAEPIANSIIKMVGADYYLETVADANKFTLGFDRNVGDASNAALVAMPAFVPNTNNYYDVYLVDGVCYEAIAQTKNVADAGAKIKALTKTTNTFDNKYTYTIVVTLTDKSEKTVTINGTIGDANEATWDGHAVNDVVTYTSDRKTGKFVSIA